MRSATGGIKAREVSCEVFVTCDGRGKGARLLDSVCTGTLVLFYEGELLRGKKAIAARQEEYDATLDPGDFTGYVFEFTHGGTAYAIDATNSTHLSRFVNHSMKRANVKPRVVGRNLKVPAIAFWATRNIAAGEELLFDYGDRRPEMVELCPWLAE